MSATIDLVGRVGALDANATMVASLASARPSSVNYHFGSFDKLLAHAGQITYEKYTHTRWERVWELPLDPEARLREFFFFQQEWSRAYPGWAAFFNFPHSARRASDTMFVEFPEEMLALFELNYARFYRLARDVWAGEVWEDPHWAEKTDSHEILADEEFLAEVIVLGWTALGMTIWTARNHEQRLGGARVSHFNALASEKALEATIGRLKNPAGRNLRS